MDTQMTGTADWQEPTTTIAAVATGATAGAGLSVVRVSGPRAWQAVDGLWHRGGVIACAHPGTAHVGWLMDGSKPLDQAVVTVFKAPASYTGQDVAEIGVHASTYVLRRLMELLAAEGVSMAGPGEFSRRAFAAGKMDLAQAEAVADLIAADTAAGHAVAVGQLRGALSRRIDDLRQRLTSLAALLELELDFADQDVTFAPRDQLIKAAHEVTDLIDSLADTYAQGRAFREGLSVVMVGAPNAGKSTLLNALCGDDRALVSDIPGTTRDAIDDLVTHRGLALRVTDTAGLRESSTGLDAVEDMGIARALERAARAAVIVLVATTADTAETVALTASRLPQGVPVVVALNKTDLRPATSAHVLPGAFATVPISALHGTGLTTLLDAVVDAAGVDPGAAQTQTLITNVRQHKALLEAAACCRRLLEGLDSGLPTDLCAQDLRQAIHHLSTVTGAVTTPDILHHIFAHFCIGK